MVWHTSYKINLFNLVSIGYIPPSVFFFFFRAKQTCK
uniref:Uncharacterized protein n=1 Tax=Anguilla anguilla TaxID=7936 RepID=A0A0E9SKS9_ANGAN